MRRRFNAFPWGLAATGLLLSLAIACGTVAAPTEHPVSAETALKIETEKAATPLSETIRKEPAAVPEPTVMPVASVDTNRPLPESPPTAAVAATVAADPAPTALPTAVPDPTKPEVGAEADWARELREAGINTGIWETNFSKRSVPYNEIFSGGVPRDGIPPIDDPRFVSVEEADEWLEEKEPVIALEINGEAKAYPLQILTWHEIVPTTPWPAFPFQLLSAPSATQPSYSTVAWTARFTISACRAICATAISSCGTGRPSPGGSS